jgi:hypothetical protein
MEQAMAEKRKECVPRPYSDLSGNDQLRTNVRLPEQATVYVLIPNLKAPKMVRIPSPRLAHREQAADFRKEVIEGTSDAGL